MKRYSEIELAEIIKNTIDSKYNDPNKIADGFKTIITGFVKFSNNKILLEDEMNEKRLNVAKWIFKDLQRITSHQIIIRLSKDLLNKNFKEGIEISEYIKYFDTFAKDIMKDFVRDKIAVEKKKISQFKRRKN